MILLIQYAQMFPKFQKLNYFVIMIKGYSEK